MKKPLAVIAIALALPMAASAQGKGHGRGNDHHQQRSAQDRREDDWQQQRAAQVRRERLANVWIPPRPAVYQPSRNDRERERWNGPPRVERNSNRWITPVYDPRVFYLARAYPNGRFVRGTGPGFVWQMHGGSRARFDVGGVYFSLLVADYRWASGWDWYGDYIVIYDDPDHYGWYLAYNVRLGMYLHVRYLGY